MTGVQATIDYSLHPGALRLNRVHQLINPVRNALRRLPELLHGPVGGVALGHVARPRVVDQAFGQRARQQKLTLGTP